MGILNIPSIGFVVVLLGTLFLFGELFVKAKGIFAILGIGIMSLYFSYHLENINFWVILLYVVGLMLIVIDGKAINDGTLAIIGLILMILGLAIPSPSILYGVFAGMGFLIGAFGSLLFVKVFPARSVWKKMTLRDRLTSEAGYNSLNESYKQLVGKRAITITPFRPTGTIEIEGKQYSATSENIWLDKGSAVKVVSVDGTRIVVKPITSD